MIINLFTLLAAETDFWGPDPIDPGVATTDIGKVLSLGINLLIIICSIAVVIWGLWGALDWITSGGTKDQLEKAQAKIRNAFLGAIMMVIVIVIWAFVSGSILGIVEINGGKAIWKIPTLREGGDGDGGGMECFNTRTGLRCAPGTPNCVCTR